MATMRFMPSRETFDVVVAANDSYLHATPALQAEQPLPRNKVTLTDDLWVGRLPQGLSRKIMQACEPAGFPSQAVNLLAQQYSFIRELHQGTTDLKWDKDNRLQECIALSRLVYPTSASFKYAARIFQKDGTIQRIIPGPVNGPGAHVYADTTKRTWLIQADLNELAKLMQVWSPSSLPQRVRRALWHCEFAYRIREIEIRWTLIVTGLEALINTDSKNATKQFTKRIPALSELLGLSGVSGTKADQAYAKRSQIAHTGGLETLVPKDKALYEMIEEILRVAVKRSILDSNVARIFNSRDTVNQGFPI